MSNNDKIAKQLSQIKTLFYGMYFMVGLGHYVYVSDMMFAEGQGFFHHIGVAVFLMGFWPIVLTNSLLKMLGL